ncbi:Phosphatidylinositol N-acetylglucosaminyltransferase subunit gpi15 [Teratosphaeria destructans]|uniref:Phosphatidylinositol N-acetylglucosaminyltransferase subunit gpi15 n=1 Tax=Teratosphaeria destructans TaxID=418781 RepID=A0A9W7W0M5_9PEZI|nr:Phosphatidylinositol N-acetylglucosaminyltransferase subunit gpi15 [Teratosphaeria destructans]
MLKLSAMQHASRLVIVSMSSTPTIAGEPSPTARRSTASSLWSAQDIEKQHEIISRPPGVRRATTSSSLDSTTLQTSPIISDRRTDTSSTDTLPVSPTLHREPTWRVSDEALHGYPKLAKFLGETGGYAIYKRFAALNARNLLYHQAKLTRLEHELNDLEKIFKDEQDLHYKVDHLFDDEHGPTTAAHQLRQKYKEVNHALEKYNRLLLEQDQLHKLPSPDPTFVEQIFYVINSDKSPKKDWLGHPENTVYAIWEDRMPVQADLVTLNPEFREQDLFTKFFISTLITWWHCLYSLFKVPFTLLPPTCEDDEADLNLKKPHPTADFDEQIYSSKAINRAMGAVVMIAASALPTCSIVALYFIDSPIGRLIFIICFSVVFAAALAVFTQSRRVEIFGASLALASVQVVFVGTAFAKMLSITRPTPTTISYTVSTRSQSKTLTSRARTLALILARLLSGVFVLTLLLHEYRSASSSPSPTPADTFSSIELAILASPIGHLVAWIATHSTRLWRLIIASGILWLIFRKGYTEESLLVIRGLGVQTSTSSPSYLWTSSTRFIPTRNIQDVFIHEAFKGFEVRFYLAIVVEGEEDVVVVFPNILPRREILEQVWRGTRACLYEPAASKA